MINQAQAGEPEGDGAQRRYQPPTVTYLGDLAELTLADKTVGGADGSTFLGLDVGS
jgi:hypothetical protein